MGCHTMAYRCKSTSWRCYMVLESLPLMCSDRSTTPLAFPAHVSPHWQDFNFVAGYQFCSGPARLLFPMPSGGPFRAQEVKRKNIIRTMYTWRRENNIMPGQTKWSRRSTGTRARCCGRCQARCRSDASGKHFVMEFAIEKWTSRPPTSWVPMRVPMQDAFSPTIVIKESNVICKFPIFG